MRQELKDIEKKMTDAVEALKERFKTLRTGRANLGILDGLLVSAYGAEVPINQVANLSVPEPTLIVAAPWDPKMAAEIDKAIRNSDLGLNPQSDGKVVRIPIPALTEER
ncbi:MAG TPA: ribosome recycling factor, partial [Thermoanaerobaculia bacterium]